MKFKLIEDYDDSRDLFRIRSAKRIEDVALDIAEVLLNIENPKEETIVQLVDELKRHKETFLDMIDQNEVLSEESKNDLKFKINKLRL